MEINGRIIKVLPLQSGEGKNGTWQKQDYVLNTENEKYPKNICFSVWGDKVNNFNISEGDIVTASIEIESREYNEKWYTNVQAWKVEKSFADNVPNNEYSEEPTDDLPF